MRKTVFLLSLVFLSSTSLAHTGNSEHNQEQVQLPEAGSTPGSMMYGLERAQESVSLALTFSKERKAEKKLKFAQERLAEAEKLGEQNDSENSAKAMEEFQKNIRSVENDIENFSSEDREKVEGQFNQTRSSAETVLTDLKDRLPEQAMNGINTALGNVNETPGNNPEIDNSGRSKPRGYMATGRVTQNTS